MHAGLVKEKSFTYDKPFKMEKGLLDNFTLAYETYGELNIHQTMRFSFVMH